MSAPVCTFFSSQKTQWRYAVKCVKRADLPMEDEADLKMEVKLLQEVGGVCDFVDSIVERNREYV